MKEYFKIIGNIFLNTTGWAVIIYIVMLVISILEAHAGIVDDPITFNQCLWGALLFELATFIYKCKTK